MSDLHRKLLEESVTKSYMEFARVQAELAEGGIKQPTSDLVFDIIKQGDIHILIHLLYLSEGVFGIKIDTPLSAEIRELVTANIFLNIAQQEHRVGDRDAQSLSELLGDIPTTHDIVDRVGTLVGEITGNEKEKTVMGDVVRFIEGKLKDHYKVPLPLDALGGIGTKEKFYILLAVYIIIFDTQEFNMGEDSVVTDETGTTLKSISIGHQMQFPAIEHVLAMGHEAIIAKILTLYFENGVSEIHTLPGKIFLKRLKPLA